MIRTLTIIFFIRHLPLTYLQTINHETQSPNITRQGKLFFLTYNDQQLDKGLYDAPDVMENEEFDFIVVGSGPTGSVIANRLSEIGDWKVLLLEAGEEANPIHELPFLSGALQFTDYNWGYYTERQNGYCLGCPDKRMWWPHGKALGGSTIINYMLYIRGNKRDYNRWAKAVKDSSWSYREVYPYFLKSEDANLEHADKVYHWKGGYLGVSDVPYRTKSVKAFVKAAQEAGYPYVDYNGQKQMGTSFVQLTTRRGIRCSAEKAFLRPVRERRNLKILTNSRVIQVLIDPKTKEAYGVRYVRNKQYHIARTKKEVIVSAGGLNSPQLLMLSGIGPSEHLKELGIPLVQNLPVGKKMYDHIAFAGLCFTVNESIVFDQEKITKDLLQFYNLVKYGSGPLTTAGGVESVTYLKTNASTDPKFYPDIELMYIGGSVSSDQGAVYRKMFSISQEIYDRVWKPLEGKNVFQVLPMLLHPKSYGFIKLKSKNPYHWPKFYANFLSDSENHDVKTLVAAIREVQRIVSQPALQKYGATIVSTPIPGCESHRFDSDDYWICAIRHITPTFYHQVATCKMGALGDPEAVVDSKLRVHGLKNLRVADTSVIPVTLSAHTMAASYMIGEKVSDMIKEKWEDPKYKIDLRNDRNRRKS